MSPYRDPYVLLGVSPDSDDSAIKSAYRRLARQHHPDHNPDDSEAAARFQDISWAFEQIKNAGARARFAATTSSSSSILGDDFEGLFARGATRPARRGKDVTVQVNLTFAQAFAGCEVEVSATHSQICSTCGGSGAAPGTASRACPLCRGLGLHKAGRLTTPCGECGGSGQQIDHRCPDCRDGRRLVRTPTRIIVPPGTADGQQLRIAGAGEPGYDEPGDLIAEITVAPSALFEPMDGADLMVNVPVSYSEAALGSHVRIPTPDKTIVLHLPPGSSSGTLLRVRGRGLPKPDGERGDLYARVVVHVPDKLSAAQRRLVTQLRGHDDKTLRDPLFSAREGDAHPS